MSSPFPISIDLEALQTRTVAPQIAAVSSVAAADDPEYRGYVYYPDTSSRFELTDYDLKEARRRSRWLCLNTSARVLRRLGRYVGCSRVKPDTKDEAFNKAVTAWWKEEGKKGNYEASKKFSYEEFLANCLYQMWRDGDCLAVHVTNPDGSPTVAAIDAGRIETPLMTSWDGKWQDGVLTDNLYQHMAYSVRVDPPGSLAMLNNKYVQIPAGHAFLFADFETQASTRGTPALTHAVADLLDLRQIDNATKEILLAHAQVGYYFKTAAGQPISGGAVSLPPPGAKQRETIQPVQGPIGSKSAPGVRQVSQVMSRADIAQLPAGTDIATLTDNRDDHPNETAIKNDIYRKLAMGLGLPVEVFVLLENLTGPGVRFVLRQTQDWREWWLESMEAFQRVDYMRRLEYAMRTGLVPKCKDANFLAHYFVQPRAVTIDDGRTASAVIASLMAGTTNYAAIYGEQGDDWKEELAQNIDELAFIEEYCATKGVDPALFYDRQNASVELLKADAAEDLAEKTATTPDKKAA